MQHNQTASSHTSDLGGKDMLEVYMFLRQVWWQQAPLMQQDAPGTALMEAGLLSKG